jgi:hypothetical protein
MGKTKADARFEDVTNEMLETYRFLMRRFKGLHAGAHDEVMRLAER